MAAHQKLKVYFPNLDGLRFISFFVVYLHHCYLSFFSYLEESNPAAYKAQAFLFQYGTLGVNFFFVLSGFLITYLLIKEKEFTGTIHVGNFYVRRILRIWPLYYLCLFIGFIVFPLIKQYTGEVDHESANPLAYLIFAANFDYMHTWPEKPSAILLSVLWSVAVEEQFYLCWPLLLKIIPVRFYKWLFLTIMAGSLVFRSFYTADTDVDHAYRYFHTFSLIGDMALGGLIAWFCSYESAFKRWITHLTRWQILFLYAATILICLFKAQLFPAGAPIIFERLVIGICFGLIIAEQNYALHSPVKMSQLKIISKLGIYTYGLYCLHLLAMWMTVKVVVKLGLFEGSLWVAGGSALLGLILSIIISLASYHLFEKWFLKWKDKFAFIVKK